MLIFRISDHFRINASNLNPKILLFQKLLRVKVEVYIFRFGSVQNTEKIYVCLQMARVSLGTTRPPIFICLIDCPGIYPALEKV